MPALLAGGGLFLCAVMRLTAVRLKRVATREIETDKTIRLFDALRADPNDSRLRMLTLFAGNIALTIVRHGGPPARDESSNFFNLRLIL